MILDRTAATDLILISLDRRKPGLRRDDTVIKRNFVRILRDYGLLPKAAAAELAELPLQNDDELKKRIVIVQNDRAGQNRITITQLTLIGGTAIFEDGRKDNELKRFMKDGVNAGLSAKQRYGSFTFVSPARAIHEEVDSLVLSGRSDRTTGSMPSNNQHRSAM